MDEDTKKRLFAGGIGLVGAGATIGVTKLASVLMGSADSSKENYMQMAKVEDSLYGTADSIAASGELPSQENLQHLQASLDNITSLNFGRPEFTEGVESLANDTAMYIEGFSNRPECQRELTESMIHTGNSLRDLREEYSAYQHPIDMFYFSGAFDIKSN
jgi:hypothetical protein